MNSIWWYFDSEITVFHALFNAVGIKFVASRSIRSRSLPQGYFFDRIVNNITSSKHVDVVEIHVIFQVDEEREQKTVHESKISRTKIDRFIWYTAILRIQLV